MNDRVSFGYQIGDDGARVMGFENEHEVWKEIRRLRAQAECEFNQPRPRDKPDLDALNLDCIRTRF